MGFMREGNRISLRRSFAYFGCVAVLSAVGVGCTAEEAPKTTEAAPESVITVAEQSASAAPIVLADAHGKTQNAPAKTHSTTSARFVEGKHYQVLKGVPKYEAGAKVQVAEFFSYGCRHCYNMEAVLKKWHDTKPGAIKFERVPAYWNPSFELLAQAYYTMVLLDVEATLHDKMFKAIHERRLPLRSQADIQKLFAEAGVSAEDFDSTFNSFAVKQKMKMAGQLFNTYGLKHVPVFVIDGKYVTDVSMAGSREAVPDVIEYLARKIKVSEKK